jgi:hypothetical protein
MLKQQGEYQAAIDAFTLIDLADNKTAATAFSGGYQRGSFDPLMTRNSPDKSPPRP